MGNKNNYLHRQNAEKMNLINEGMRTWEQFFIDCALMELHEEGYGYDRCKRFLEGMQKKADKYFGAFVVNDEQEYLQECMDRELNNIIKGKQKLHTFAERYPMIKHRGL